MRLRSLANWLPVSCELGAPTWQAEGALNLKKPARQANVVRDQHPALNEFLATPLNAIDADQVTIRQIRWALKFDNASLKCFCRRLCRWPNRSARRCRSDCHQCNERLRLQRWSTTDRSETCSHVSTVIRLLLKDCKLN
jgi:hypothetical protein